MFKKIYFLFLLFLIFPVIVFAEDYVTVIYNANDGSGRTKTVQLPKGDSYILEGNSIFDQIDDDPNDSMDDKLISNWRTKSDGSGLYVSINYSYKNKPNDPSAVYTLFNESDTVNLYAQWVGREDASNCIENLFASGEAVSVENGNVTIERGKDVTFNMVFKESPYDQFSYLNYIELPDYIVDYIEEDPDYKAYLLKEHSLIVNISYAGSVYQETSYFHIDDGKIFIDIPPENSKTNSATNLTLRFTLWVKFEKRQINNRELTVKVFVFNEHEDTTEEIYPKGNIVTRYVDADTDEEFDSVSSTDVLGASYLPEKLSYEGYELVEEPTETHFEYEEYDQVIVYKYRKVKEVHVDPIENDSNEHNPETGGSLPVVLIVLLVITGVVTTVIYNKKRLLIKQ